MPFGEFLTRWTVIVAVGLFALALCLRWNARAETDQLRARWLWTAGCFLFVIHVACAFQFVHAWSHAAALEATARETREKTGWNSGVGLYANYVFLIVWLADTAWWWRGIGPDSSRGRWVDAAVVGYLGFIAFNATVVFGDGVARVVGIGATALLCAAGYVRLRRDGRDKGRSP
ncbi:MAG: hypothetical protein AB7O26_04350 [Planctomycetaceae bacterium]